MRCVFECKSSDLHRIYAFSGRGIIFTSLADSHYAYEFIGLLLQSLQLFSFIGTENNKVGALHRKMNNLINQNRK